MRQHWSISSQIYGIGPSEDRKFPMIVAGLINDGGLIKNEILTTLVQLSCIYDTSVYVTVAQNAQVLQTLLGRLQDDLYDPSRTHLRCQPMLVETQPSLPNGDLSRVQKLAFVRDFQRGKLMDFVAKNKLSRESSIILLMDLDLLELPPVSQIMDAGRSIWGDKNKLTNDMISPTVDAVCAGGVTVDDQDGMEGYYDSLATIFEPDTYMVPLADREISSLRPGENKDLIIQDNGLNFYNIWKWIKQQERVPVRSCFGGMTLYKASVFLDHRCSYSTPGPGINISGYEVINVGVCEHIVLNTCLQSVVGMRISILPALRTRWSENNGLKTPRDLNIAATKFQITSQISSTETMEFGNEKNLEGSKVTMSKEKPSGGSRVPLAQLKPKAKIRRGDKLTVLQPGPLFGMPGTVVASFSQWIHLKVGHEILPFGLDDLALA